MRTLVLTITAAILALQATAQHVANFEDLSLSKADTYYVNYTSFGNDVGFTDSFVHFPCTYDSTSFGKYWKDGFAYSNMTDSATSGLLNMYAAKADTGYANSETYLVCNMTSGMPGSLYIADTAKGDSVYGFYITNSTYAYNSMRDGDGFAKKFGGITGNDPDWFTVTFKGYHNGIVSSDSVVFYLADFRSASSSADYIVNTWQWVNLKKLGKVDTLVFTMNSTDTSFGYINTPLYFCVDNFTINAKKPASVNHVPVTAAAKIYPVPANNELFVELADKSVKEITVYDMTGKMIDRYNVTEKTTTINTAVLSQGAYILKLTGDETTTVRFIKQ